MSAIPTIPWPQKHLLNRRRRYGLNDISTTNADAVINAWLGRIGQATNGAFFPGQAIPSANTIRATTDLVNGLMSDGLWPFVFLMNTYPPDSLTAVVTPLVYQNPTVVWGSFGGWDAATDLDVNGLKGNGLGKYFDTGANLQNLTSPFNYSVFVYTSAIDLTERGLSFGAYLSAGPGFFCGAHYTDDKWYSAMNNFSTNELSAASLGPGFYGHSRLNTPLHTVYFASSGSPHAAVASESNAATSPLPTLSAYAHAVHNDGAGPQLYTGERISFICVLNAGVSAAGSLLMFNRIQAYRQAIGGGFV